MFILSVIASVIAGIYLVRLFDATEALGKFSPKLLLVTPFIAILYVLGLIAVIASLVVVVVFVWPTLLAILLSSWVLYGIVMAPITLICMFLYPFWKVASGIKEKHFPAPARPITYSYVDRYYGKPLR
jgi:hypothetical protein